MTHPFAQTRVYFQTDAPDELDALAERLSQRLIQIGVPDYVLAYMNPHMASGVGIHVAIARYEPLRLIDVLTRNLKLDNGEDLDYFQDQTPDEDVLTGDLEGRVLAILSEAVPLTDGVTPKELDEYLDSGRWTIFKIRRGGEYDSDDLSDAEIIAELRRYF